MKIFHCSQCEQLVFFENTLCVNCGKALAYLPDRKEMGTLEPLSDGVVSLRDWRLEDRDALVEMANDDAIQQWTRVPSAFNSAMTSRHLISSARLRP